MGDWITFKTRPNLWPLTIVFFSAAYWMGIVKPNGFFIHIFWGSPLTACIPPLVVSNAGIAHVKSKYLERCPTHPPRGNCDNASSVTSAILGGFWNFLLNLFWLRTASLSSPSCAEEGTFLWEWSGIWDPGEEQVIGCVYSKSFLLVAVDRKLVQGCVWLQVGEASRNS